MKNMPKSKSSVNLQDTYSFFWQANITLNLLGNVMSWYLSAILKSLIVFCLLSNEDIWGAWKALFSSLYVCSNSFAKYLIDRKFPELLSCSCIFVKSQLNIFLCPKWRFNFSKNKSHKVFDFVTVPGDVSLKKKEKLWFVITAEVTNTFQTYTSLWILSCATWSCFTPCFKSFCHNKVKRVKM